MRLACLPPGSASSIPAWGGATRVADEQPGALSGTSRSLDGRDADRGIASGGVPPEPTMEDRRCVGAGRSGGMQAMAAMTTEEGGLPEETGHTLQGGRVYREWSVDGEEKTNQFASESGRERRAGSKQKKTSFWWWWEKVDGFRSVGRRDRVKLLRRTKS